WFAPPSAAIATPVYTEPFAERSTATCAALDEGFQALTIPSRPTNTKTAGPPAIAKPLVELSTTPVGCPAAGDGDPGIVTTSEFLLPLASYSVDVPVPLLATHRAPVGPKAIPQ